MHRRARAGLRSKTVSALGSAAALLAACGDSNVYVEPPPPSVTVAHPLQQDVVDYMQFTGRTDPIAEVEVRARVLGELEQVHFEESDFIEEGSLLFTIEQDLYQAEVDRAKAALAQAKAQLDLASARLTRTEKAAETQAVSEIDVLEALAERDGRKADVSAREAELEQAELDLDYTTIEAPISGRVGRLEVDAGNLVGPGEATLLTTIVQYDPIYAYFDMPERQLLDLMADTKDRGLEAGDNLKAMRNIPLELGLTNQEGYPIPGFIHYADQGVDAATGTFLMRGIFENPYPYQVVPGLFVRVRTPRDPIVGALLVPERALGTDQGGRFLLLVDDEDVVQHQRVELGPKVGSLRVIISGLEATNRVVVDGLLRARPGAKVTPERTQLQADETTASDG